MATTRADGLRLSSNSMKWHYSTIGIHDVFLSAVDRTQLPQCYGTESRFFSSPEFTGTIKGTPEDFVVREIASKKLKLPVEWRIADVRESTGEAAVLPASVVLATDPGVSDDVLDIEKEMNPQEIIKRVLQTHHGENAVGIQEGLQKLHTQALNCISKSESLPSLKDLWISSISGDSSCISAVPTRGGDRGSLHRSLKMSFPLLQSETRKKDGTEDSWVRVTIDESFFALASSVCDPGTNLLELYKFRKRGCHGMPKKRKRSHDRNFKYKNDDPFQFLLPLQPGLSKDDRRKLHHVISKQSRDFETSTVSNHVMSDGSTTTALVLQWSKGAFKRCQEGSSGPRVKKSYLAFCMKKRAKEHLTAQEIMIRALRCRQSDLGTAGIKDMYAVTYQYCTVRDMDLNRLVQANTILKDKSIEIGSIRPVDHFLQQGDLEGNNFVITVRDVKRVKVTIKNGIVEEEFGECDKSHIVERADAIRKFGFVNFYGEQRVGVPGETDEVGVRTFDIGRAMLQRDFDEAVNLLITGRLVCRGTEEQESDDVRHVRQIWKETGGNVEETYKALPKGDSMPRERIVLQGLKRYHNSLEAFKCLPFGIRHFWINAYQSYVWNKMTSERIELYGHKAVVGDLYIAGDEKVLFVTKDVLSDVAFNQVVLPLPGYNILYPTNEIGQRYEDLLAKENVKFEKDAPLEATAKGTYRHIVIPMTSLIIEFPEASVNVVNSFRISFDLPSGSYATMLLRELMVSTVARA